MDKDLFYIFDRGIVYSLISKNYNVKKIEFDKEYNTGFGFQNTKALKRDYIKLYKEKNKLKEGIY